MPVTLTIGRETLPFFREAATWVAARLGVEVEEVPGGHSPHLDRHKELAEAIGPLLRQACRQEGER